jgi:CRISPR-associated protein Cas1
METVFVAKDATLERRDNTLLLRMQGQRLRLPIDTVRHVVLTGRCRLDSALLSLLGQHGVRLSQLDWYGYYKGSFEPIERNPSGTVRLAQARLVLDATVRLSLARRLVEAAAHNMATIIGYHRRRTNPKLEAIEASLARAREGIATADEIPTLMGVESQIRQAYWDGWPLIDERLAFGRRVRRPPNNPINCLMSFLNGLLYAVMRHEIGRTHLEATFALLHAPARNRASLALDLAEPFRPVVVDREIMSLVRKDMLTDTWFERHEGVCLLTESGRRAVSEHFGERLERLLDGKTLRACFYAQALSLEREALGTGRFTPYRGRA